jgi:hypothetical protein
MKPTVLARGDPEGRQHSPQALAPVGRSAPPLPSKHLELHGSWGFVVLDTGGGVENR